MMAYLRVLQALTYSIDLNLKFEQENNLERYKVQILQNSSNYEKKAVFSQIKPLFLIELVIESDSKSSQKYCHRFDYEVVSVQHRQDQYHHEAV